MPDNDRDAAGGRPQADAPTADEMAEFHRKLRAVCEAPLLADDPLARTLIARMMRDPDPEHFAELMTALADRGRELAVGRYGSASRGLVRRGPERRPPEADDAGRAGRLMLRL